MVAGSPIFDGVHGANGVNLRNDAGVVVGTLARKFEPLPDMRCIKATVLAIATWSREHSDPKYQQRLKNDTWEVVIPELVFEPH